LRGHGAFASASLWNGLVGLARWARPTRTGARTARLSFAAQALATAWSVKNEGKLEHKVHHVPKEVDEWVASLKLKTMGISIDTLTAERKKYLVSWEMGT
jgi:S-adenosylhomocysteine hydrolase